MNKETTVLVNNPERRKALQEYCAKHIKPKGPIPTGSCVLVWNDDGSVRRPNVIWYRIVKEIDEGYYTAYPAKPVLVRSRYVIAMNELDYVTESEILWVVSSADRIRSGLSKARRVLIGAKDTL